MKSALFVLANVVKDNTGLQRSSMLAQGNERRAHNPEVPG
jgi:hypothetical protein